MTVLELRETLRNAKYRSYHTESNVWQIKISNFKWSSTLEIVLKGKPHERYEKSVHREMLMAFKQKN